ncbi:EAL domain-containing protein [Paraliobacillus salinarum]|uniref:EAL domain-containing protein n=1 Tax=Paraliobacillus salinarum TaxID=1158996 RepID=UPI0015F6F604|nr:EAL domain-containing protein [Paraliobacillus salinarum]
MLIDTVIEEEKFHHHFQPIFCTNSQEKIGYEVLLRSNLHDSPLYTFQEAKKANRLYDLDTMSIEKAVATFCSSVISKYKAVLFLNVFPSTIVQHNFEHFLESVLVDNEISKEQVVLEISESELIEDPALFKRHIIWLKNQGYMFALDDVGKGYANFDMLIHLEPEYIKLDRLFSERLDQTKKKQNLIRFFLQYCRENTINLILEGVETKEELQVAKSLGVSYIQGFLLGRPNNIQHWE